MQNSTKTPLDFYPLLAQGMASLIDRWRGEISHRKDFRPKLPQRKLEDYLRKAADYGVPATMVALTVLLCERTFRIRRLTEKDIDQVIDDIKAGLSKNGMLTWLQAHLLIKSLEPRLRNQIKKIPIPIIFGFDTSGPHPKWYPLMSENQREEMGAAPKRIVPNRPGRLPVLGPIIAGVIIETLFEETLPKQSRKMGIELCELLLKRKVQKQEFRKWRALIDSLYIRGENLRPWFKKTMSHAYFQTFEMENSAVTPEVFIRQCQLEPEEERLFFWFNQEDLLKAIYSVKWGDSKTLPKQGGQTA